uniref:TIL domain-containing protein n=1 Tax=Tetranychus urticae TaxID=32264 RepID=T1L4S8_TETUR
MIFLGFTIAVNFLVLAVSANKTVPVTDSTPGQSTSDFRPRTAAKVWNPCGTNCPLTCANPKPRACIKSCKADFFCPSGYLENSIGQCVFEEDCDNLQPIPIDNPVPLPRPFPRFPGFRPLPRPCPKPFPISNPESTVENSTDVPNDFSQFPESNDFQSFESVDFPVIKLSMGPARPKPVFQISPVNFDPIAVANGAPIPPPAVVRTSGSNFPYISMPAMVPKSKPLIDLDPTVPRPVLRVSKEQSSENEN